MMLYASSYQKDLFTCRLRSPATGHEPLGARAGARVNSPGSLLMLQRLLSFKTMP